MTKRKDVKTTDKGQCSLFEEMLMWTSYRYCIGRHTYVTTMADDIGRHYYNKLSDERKIFTANDIRREIFDNLKYLPFKLEITRFYNTDEFDPMKVLFNFFEKENIDTIDKLAYYSSIRYSVNEDKYEFDKCTPTIKKYVTRSDFDDLIPWTNLANLFDINTHKILHLSDGTSCECFPIWMHKLINIEGTDNYRLTEFGYEQKWSSVNDFINGKHGWYIPKTEIQAIEDMKTVWKKI